MAGLSPTDEPPAYRESRALVPAVLGWAVVGIGAYVGAGLVWNWLRGEPGLLYSMPGVVAFLAVGLGAVVARQQVEVRSDELRVGNSRRLSRGVRLVELQQVEVQERPPSGRRWPFARLRVYSVGNEPGTLLTLADGERLFIGTPNAEQLAATICRLAPHVRRGEARGRTSG